MKFFVFLILTLSVGAAFAQNIPDTGGQSQIPGNTAPPLLQKPYETVRDFFNFFAFADGVMDSNGAYLESANAGASFGERLGGGAAGYHQFATGSISLYYNGDYRHYDSNTYGSGTDQTLSFFYQKLAKRWQFTLGETAGDFFQGGGVYNTSPSPNTDSSSVIVQTSPIATKTEYAGTTLSATYQQSLRTSYAITGSYFLDRYNGPVSIGSNNFIGSFSGIYRVTRRTSVSASYSHSNFLYQRKGGNSNVDAGYATIGHDFASHWTVSASGGITRANSSGTFRIPIIISPTLPPAYIVGPYNDTSLSPYYQGTVSRFMRHNSLSISGGESVGPGNGYYLASKVQYLNGYYNYALRRSNISANGYLSRLASASSANVATGKEITLGLGASYAYNLIRHVGLNLRYDYIKYSTAGNLNVPSDNRISFGVYFTSKDVPLSWH